jgi:hypothetical protein
MHEPAMTTTSWVTLAIVVVLVSPVPAAEGLPANGSLMFESDVRPIFKAYCFECHGEGEKLKGQLDLRLRRLITQAGKSGPALVPGRHDASLLFEKVAQGAMPPGKKKLSTAEVARIGRWIDEGARTAGPEPLTVATGWHPTTQDRSFWAFQPVHRPNVPLVRHSDQVRTPIDTFLLAQLEAHDLTFAPEADKRTLIRRVYFDLAGLPPAPEDVSRFLADTQPDAYERLIDRLLASPHYGEHWGRHWLDVAGYADSDGYTGEDTVRPLAYKYRDYVIRSLNADKPFDEFIREQLAGDEMVPAPYRDLSPGDVEKLTATGFLRMVPDGTGSGTVEQPVARNQVVADTIKVVSSSLLGLTIGCAQCHNHRYDPIPQTDYYRLRAVFEPALNPKNWRTPAQRLIALATTDDRARAAQIEVEAAKIDQERLKKQQEYIEQTFEKELAKLAEPQREPIRTARKTPVARQTTEQKKLLKDHPSVNVTAGSLYLYEQKAANDLKSYADKAAAIRATKPKEDFLPALTEVPHQVPTTYLFHRGDHDQPRQAVEPGGLTILDDMDPLKLPAKEPARPSTGRRLAFAHWLTDGRHPLTARVLVNRVWMHHFGRGIVGTPGDLGFLGERPTHPELLDWLADEFVAGGWRLKRLHKLILTSRIYRQSSQRDSIKDKIDPDNRLVGRMRVRRLEAESVRDAMLTVSGRMNPTPFGPPVPIRVDEVGQVVVGIDTTDSAGRPTGKVIPLHGSEWRRSVYIQVRRSRPLAVLEAFDAPLLEPNCESREASTVAPQSLLLMNNEFVLAQAEAFARRVRRASGEEARAQVTCAWGHAFGREPAEHEVADAMAFLAAQGQRFSGSTETDRAHQALTSLCHALLSSNAFLYVD